MNVRTQKPGSAPPVNGPATNGRPGHANKKPRPEAYPKWIWPVGFGAALLAALIAYGPALQGQFVFDDVHMHFAGLHPDRLPLLDWLKGARPLTDLSYWINYQMGGAHTLGYHLTNILLHVIAALMVFLIVRKVLELGSVEVRRRTLVAGFCGAIFLLHPMQTEAVAYISGRSENLSVALAFAAWACFLYRPSNAITFGRVLLVLVLFGAAVGGKEHVAVLPAVLLLTDYYWNPGFSLTGVWRNWRLYAPLAFLGLILGAFLYSYLANEPTVGFHMKEFTPMEYLFTQFRVVFIYLRLFLFPFGQSADYAIELSHTPFEHGAILGMIAILGATVAAIVWRKRFPIASYGFFVALVFFLPTSIVPIRDLAVERRLYLPMIGLLLIASEMLVRVHWNERTLGATLAGIVVVAGAMTWNRSQVWASPIALWSDAVEKTPQKPRTHFGLAGADYLAGRYPEAIRQYELSEPAFRKDGTFYRDWAVAYTAAGRYDEALEKARKAVQLDPTAPTYHVMGRVTALHGDIADALAWLDKAEKDDPTLVPVYIDRGNILRAVDRNKEACEAYQKAWSLDPQNLSAAKGLAVCAGPH